MALVHLIIRINEPGSTLSAYTGSGKTVQFKVVTDPSIDSNLFLDDVSMSASATMSQLQPISLEVYPGAALQGK